MKFNNKLFFLILFTAFSGLLFSQEDLATIEVNVSDKSYNENLPYASVLIKELSMGGTTDEEGNYIFKVSPGTYTIIASYLGFKEINKKVTVGKSEKLKVLLALTSSNELEEVVVTVQVLGQLSAIREQVSSNKIVNVVSSEKMQELPDANTAEALGRLPGISLQRSSGEAQKIIIRGVAPENNNITIAGVKLASNNASDRSVDLSMMQNEMFSGAEVSKTLRPDMDAGAIGGTVDLRLAKASDKSKFNAMYEGGYNNLFSKVGDTKFTGGGSVRLFENKLGIKFQGSFENKLVSSHNFNGNYSDPIIVLEQDDEGQLTGNQSLISRTSGVHMALDNAERKRISGSLTLDFRSSFVDISFFNLINVNPNKNTLREEMFYFLNSTIPSSSKSSSNNTDKFVSTHLLENNFRFFNTELDLKLSFSRTSTNRTRRIFPFNEVDRSGESINQDWLVFKDPKEILEQYGQTEITNTKLITNDLAKDDLSDLNYNLDLKWKIPFDIQSLNLDGVFSLGGLYTRKVRSSNSDYQYVDYRFGKGRGPRNVSLEMFPWMDWPEGDLQGIPATNFIDQNYKPVKFLNGEYDLSWSPDLNRLLDMQSKLNEESPLLFNSQGLESFQNDYENTEELLAAFVMFELNIGNLLLVPGLRMEKANTSYSSFSILTNLINTSGVSGSPIPISIDRENQYFFPSINMKWKLNKTLSLRGAIFKSISRPNFNNLAPRSIVSTDQSLTKFDSKNPFLKPAIAWSYDLSLEAFNDKLGLLTINPFYKRIDDYQVYLGNYFPLRNDRIVNPPSGLLENIPGIDFYQVDWLTNSSETTVPINNPEKSEFFGVEISYQTNFRYLKNTILKGFVFDVNLTFLDSKTKYPFFKDVVIGVDNSGFFPQDIIGYEYTTREDKMTSQPDFIANVILGWDYKGFSSRISYRHQGVTLGDGGDKFEFRQNFKSDLQFVDVSLRQKLFKHYELFLNATNITNFVDERYVLFNNEQKLPLNLNYFGNRIKFGLRYRF